MLIPPQLCSITEDIFGVSTAKSPGGALFSRAMVDMDGSNYVLALHAGTNESWKTNPSLQKTIEDTLHAIVKRAGANLSAGAKAVDVVQDAVSDLEDCDLFNAGKGSILNEDCEHEVSETIECATQAKMLKAVGVKLEAAIVDGASGSYGAVACVRNVKNPVHAARSVMDGGRQKFLVGEAADKYAQESGLEVVPNEYFTTTARKAHLQSRPQKSRMTGEDLETVGAVALDLSGNLAAAGSTGGLTGKMRGRVGDTSVVGAGIFADENVAVVW